MKLLTTARKQVYIIKEREKSYTAYSGSHDKTQSFADRPEDKLDNLNRFTLIKRIV